MARCGCSSVGAIGTALVDGCGVEVSGAGTAGSPFVVETVIDPDATNGLSCSVDGLYVQNPVMDAGDDSMTVTLAGPGPADFSFVVKLAPDSDMDGVNLLDIFANGLGVASAPVNIGLKAYDSALYFPSAPPTIVDGMWKVVAGTATFVADGSGNGTIVLPLAYTGGIITVIAINGDASSDAFDVGAFIPTMLDRFAVHCEGISSTTAGENVRINYIVLGYDV